MQVLITGSRNWKNFEAMFDALNALPKDTLLIHGAGRGADQMAETIARRLGFPKPKAYPARWKIYGRGAGPKRNQQMLEENPDISLILAFHEDLSRSKGTSDMVRRGEKKGIRVQIITG